MLSRTWEKENFGVSDGNRTHDCPLSCEETGGHASCILPGLIMSIVFCLRIEKDDGNL